MELTDKIIQLLEAEDLTKVIIKKSKDFSDIERRKLRDRIIEIIRTNEITLLYKLNDIVRTKRYCSFSTN